MMKRHDMFFEKLRRVGGRSPFICQSQSLNIHLTDCTTAKLSSMHFYGWKKGLKTGMYYLRTRAAADAIKFTVDQQSLAAKSKRDAQDLTTKETAPSVAVRSRESKEECLSCGA